MVFYEITRNAIRAAVEQPRELSLDLVNAQQARRALDYLVGFNLSPLLWKKVRRGLSAGRVQSPALRMICEREEEIAAFVAREYWTIEGEGTHSEPGLSAEAARVPRRARSSSSASPTRRRRARSSARCSAAARRRRAAARQAQRRRHRPQAAPPQSGAALHHLDAAAGGRAQARLQRAPHHAPRAAALRGGRHRRGQRRAHHLHAHRLGDARGGGGAARSARSPPGSTVQDEVAEEPRIYKTKSKNAQEAHEAIRPTSAAITPADVEGKIEDDLYRLYSLIWKRAVASQMSHALFDTVAVDLLAGPDGPRAAPAARQRLDAGEARLHLGVPGGQRRRRRRTIPITCCRRCRKATP